MELKIFNQDENNNPGHRKQKKAWSEKGLKKYMVLQWNPINTVTNGPKKLAVLTGERINEDFFYKKM